MALFGLKLGIGEFAVLNAARRLWRERRFDFLELYVPKGADALETARWEWYDGVLVIHAPHAVGGFNFARREMAMGNFRCLEMLEQVRERMSPDMMVFHPGLDGDTEEALRQIANLRKDFPELHRIMLMENKPRVGLHGERCLGASPEEMRHILEVAGCGFCLDVRHAVAFAAWAGLDWAGVLTEFAALEPMLWHAADGRMSDQTDSHDHIRHGDLPWEDITALWRAETLVTIECGKNEFANLEDFVEDLESLRMAERSKVP